MAEGLRGIEAFGSDAALLGLTAADAPDVTAAAVGDRIRQARRAAGLTGETLGGAVGLTKDKISKIESGKRRVDVGELKAIADALGTTTRVLLGKRDHKPAPWMATAARLAPGADQDADRALRATARQLLSFDDLLTRVAGMPEPIASPQGSQVSLAAADRDRFPMRPRTMGSAAVQGRDLAEVVRSSLNLGANALGDLATLIELHFPVDVSTAPFGTSCDGLCVHAAGRAYILASSDYPEGHLRFTLAHELGHHLFGDPRPVITEGDHQMFAKNTVERRVNAFAGHLLMPDAGVRQVLAWTGHVAGAPVTRRHLAALMEHFDVSRAALMYQLRTLGVVAWDRDPDLDDAPVGKMLSDNSDVAPTQRSNTTYATTRSPQRLVRAARAAAQREVLGLNVLATLLGREDDEELWNAVMNEAAAPAHMSV